MSNVRTIIDTARAVKSAFDAVGDLGLRVAEALERARRERDDAHARAEAAILNLNVPREDSK
jgi:hypothetical protein